MGLESLRKIASSDGPPGAPREILELVPGNRLENFEELRNCRLQHDGPYLRIIRRGGTVAQKTVFGSINTLYPFSARVNGTLTDFVAIHNTAGDIILWNVTADTTSTILSGFPTAEKIQLAHSGIFLYAFSYDAGVAKYYDLEASSGFTYLQYNKSYVSATNLLHDNVEEQNILGYEKGQQVIVFPNVPPAAADGTNQIHTSASGAGSIDPAAYAVQSFIYKYEGGEYLIDGDGVEYKESRVFGFAKGEPPMKFTVGGSGSAFTIHHAYFPLDEDGNVAYQAYVSTIEGITKTSDTAGFISGKDPVGVGWTSQIGGVASADSPNKNLVIPFTSDTEDLVGQPANKELNSDGITTSANGDFTEPTLYRQYVFVDLLNDGSISIPGQPVQIEVGMSEILETGVAKVRLTVTAASANVAKRFLCASRWQPSPQKAFTPSLPAYPNSPLFIAQEVDPAETVVTDNKPDDKLLRPLTEQLRHLAGGVPDLFGPGQLSPNSIARFQGSLLLAGYKVDRPVPDVYTNPATATVENIFVNITATTQLANNMALAFQFEYTDGKRSNIVETEEFLQEGSTTQTEPVACDQERATADQEVLTGASTDGDLELTYDGITITIPLTAASHSTPSNAAEAIRAAVQAEGNLRISAVINTDPTIHYEEERYGEEFNTNVINIDPVIEPATGFIDVTANNLGGGGSENHTITIDGNSTSAIVINDTDTLEQIVDKYVSEINGDATISTDWTASKVDNGDGTWRCLITADANGTAWNGKTIDVTGETDVTLVIDSPTSGGKDDPGVTFDTQDPALAGASEPEGVAAEAWVAVRSNDIGAGETADQEFEIDGNITSTFTVSGSDSLEDVADALQAAIVATGAITTDWTVTRTDFAIEGVSYPGVKLVAKNLGASWNGKSFEARPVALLGVQWSHAAPGETWSPLGGTTAGGADSCVQASASVDVSANNLAGSATEDHTITVDGNSTSPITINDTDTTEQIVDKYIAEIEATAAIDKDWEATKSDQGGGTWRLVLTYRQYGTVGNGRAVDVTGETDVTLTVTSPSSGGDDGGTVPSGSATEVNANRMQIHSLNTLVSKVFILGRTTDPSKTFHLIEEIEISDPEAHGMIIDLPNTTDELDDIEANTHATPATEDLRETITLQNYVNVGTPFQEISISGQRQIMDESEILRAIPLQFDLDKTQMRYRFLLLTDKNLQLAYLVDTGSGFDKDIELFFEGIRIKDGSRSGITLVETGRVIMHTEDGIKMFDQGKVRKMLDDREYDLVNDNLLKTAILNRTHNEYWLVFNDQKVLAWDLEFEKAVKTFSFDGPGISGSVREGVYGHGNMIIAIGGQVCYTDLAGTHDDLGEGAANSHYINAFLLTKHMGKPTTQTKILEIDVGGQVYNAQVLLDLQKERLESDVSSWSKAFSADVSSAVKTLDISGTSFQFHKRAIMPKIKIDLTGDGEGFLSHVTLKYLEFENRGKARE